MSMAYIVSGNTGEYSGFTCWYLKVFLSEAPAQEMTSKLNAFLKSKGWDRELYNKTLKIDFNGYDQEPGDVLNPDDPQLTFVSYGGEEYEVIEVPLDEAVIYNIRS